MSIWERFCRDQARESAKKFFDKVRRFKERNPSTSDIHDSVFANEFSAAFLEESLFMSSGSGIVNGLGVNSSSGGSNTMTMSRQGVVDQRKGGPQSKGGGRSWWNIFKWSKFSKTESGNRKTSTASTVTVGAVVVLEGLVNLLNLNDSVQTLTWQHCRLVLLQEQGNHQLEVFCPPKNTIPKMSLFCFLIEDVRSTSLLEIPDSSSSFVIKSPNHGEYVFDAGSEASKQQWIKTIQQFSGKQSQNPVPNGRLPPSSLPSSRPTVNGYACSMSTVGAETLDRSPARAASSTATRSSTLPRSSHRAAVTVSDDVIIEDLTSSPVVYGRRNSSEPAREGASRISALLSAEQHCDSDESILCDVSSFIRSQPQRSPNRHRKAQSLFAESPSTASSSHSTPPPIPKRTSIPSTPRSTNVGLSHSNQAAFSSAAPTGTSSAHSSPYRGESRRKFSHPNVEVHLPVPSGSLHELPSPGNLETCSQSSSSSALHPVSLAAVQRTSHQRKGSVPSSPTELQRLQSAQKTQEASNRGRKISAPVLAGPNSFQLEDPWKGVRRLNGRFDPYRSDERLNIMEEDNIEEILVGGRGHNRSQSAGSSVTDAVPRNASPLNFHAADSSDGFRSSPESGVLSLLRGLETEATNSGTLVQPLDSRTQADDAPSDPSTRINSSSSEDTESHPQDTPDGSNPIYVETTEAQGYSQSVTFTQHPYESWATTHQDVQNLRALAHFPWFHGMISRTNASQLVLAAGEEGSGQYLVRQSESREGDFVLTFNYHNRAKHLRMAVDESGCNIQHLWFSDVMGMLEYFKINSIPLESFWLNDDVKLTTYIERSASDTFRTTTVVNVDRLHRSPPRRTRSLHLGMSRAIGTRGTSTSNPDTPSPTEQQLQDGNQESNSLPHTARNSTSWRQLFRSQRSSSAGNVGRVQRRHSANAGSLLDTRRVVSHDRSENNYVFRY